jgi:hypothetical protein
MAAGADELPKERGHIAGLRVQRDFLTDKAHVPARVDQAGYFFNFFVEFTAGNVDSGERFLFPGPLQKAGQLCGRPAPVFPVLMCVLPRNSASL